MRNVTQLPHRAPKKLQTNIPGQWAIRRHSPGKSYNIVYQRANEREREVKIVIIGVIAVIGLGKIFGNGHGIFQKRHGVTR